MTASRIELVHVSKTWGAQKAVIDVSLDIEPGEFFSLLGPSGCGKTTTLRMIAGLETPDADGGLVRIGGEVVNNKRPYERNLGMVFQGYALFPHLSIERNIAFGLEQRGVSRADIGTRVRKAMEQVRLPMETFGARKPAELSGGQRQRVALARALVVEPPILLLDEPLGALDLQLRKEMQFELKALNKRLGITFVYVTHDQEEALTMSDRIAVMDQSRLAQVGSPAEIYERPKTSFVARFIGATNFVEGEARDGRVVRSDGSFAVDELTSSGPVKVVVRPERVRIGPAGEGISGQIAVHVYRGENIQVRVRLDGGGDIVAAVPNEGLLRKPVPWTAGDRVGLTWDPGDARVVEG